MVDKKCQHSFGAGKKKKKRKNTGELRELLRKLKTTYLQDEGWVGKANKKLAYFQHRHEGLKKKKEVKKGWKQEDRVEVFIL